MKKLLLAMALLSLGCDSYSLTTPTQDTLAGRWDLTEVEGASLPYVVPNIGPVKAEIVEDVLNLTPPNTFTEVTTIRNTQNGQVTTQTVNDSGTYEFNSYAVTFHFQSNGTFGAGTLTGKTMKVITSGVSFTYKKHT
jgi:hypothetical protein